MSEGQRIAFMLEWFPSHAVEPDPDRDPEVLLEQTQAFWDSWSCQCVYEGPFRDAVQRSLITLKALTYSCSARPWTVCTRLATTGSIPPPDVRPLQRGLLEFLEGAWQRPDEGIWEIRAGRRHFTHSKVMAWVAVDRSIRDAERCGFDAPLERWKGCGRAFTPRPARRASIRSRTRSCSRTGRRRSTRVC